jgi:hypothetical protein
VRTHVGVALLSSDPDPLPAIREAARGSDIVAIDGADLLSQPLADQAAAELAGPSTLVLAATDADSAASLARDAGRTDITILDLAQLSEVIA